MTDLVLLRKLQLYLGLGNADGLETARRHCEMDPQRRFLVFPLRYKNSMPAEALHPNRCGAFGAAEREAVLREIEAEIASLTD